MKIIKFPTAYLQDATPPMDSDIEVLQAVLPETERSTIVSALTVASESCDDAANILSSYVSSGEENE